MNNVTNDRFEIFYDIINIDSKTFVTLDVDAKFLQYDLMFSRDIHISIRVCERQRM